ncbi:UvrD-helicase domain-containing protein [Chitinimonas taiwanensis]|jgi:DNA helicase-2/ATP-dependent DNA helicase PcrA|uniref:DNA 3'-5' helicase n=1 Tax=Chitinimonas taiwanensis DSM 18899 TaxID=1121279 RepID=A0A1K2H577_9NEIS|nr:UvrD-helicase domain-containing protein [Chitinimonas taiwanensis]SFZ70589.1 DNA helicase-2 / ATP-dependent DNA helicase PcrA [Chitinimonas taiwanensis DSM 18899]
MSSSLLSGLNPEQLAAVTLPAVPALILAGAGSGKTRVLTTRIVWLLSTGQVSQHGILAVTFTNKAAKEMLTRVSAQLPINARSLWIGTFHGLCNRMLRLHWRDAGLPEAFQIMDTADQLSAIKRLLKALNIDDEKYPPRELMYYINANKEEGRRPAEVEAWDQHSQQMKQLYDEYERQCRREGVVDFAELLLRCYELLRDNAALRSHYHARFRYILVDEFQDTNRLQYKWLKLLAGKGDPLDRLLGKQPAATASDEAAAVFAVGDDDQSIYAFRGANVGNMADFQRDFAVETVIKLEQNYRSHGNILDAANALIAHNRGRLGKNLWTSESAGDPIRVYEAASDFEEASFVVDEVRNLQREGTPLADMAVLYRSNAQSRVIEHALFQAGLPYRVYGGLRFFERQEIKHALAYLRLIANPDDDNALLRVINFPVRGIGNRTLEILGESARGSGTSIWQAACSGGAGRSAAAVARFVQLIEGMRAQQDGLQLAELVQLAIEQSGLIEHYRNEKEGQERLENLDQLISAAAVFVQENENDVNAFLAHASLEAGDHEAAPGQDALQLMSVHASKGLEFHAVFLTGIEEGLFPHDNSLNSPEGLEEERRLAYVAITRARRKLYLSLAQSRMLHGQTRFSIASRFLSEIPEDLLKWLNRGYAPSAMPARKIEKAAPEHGLRVGCTVEHAKFGQGVVVDYDGTGPGANVQVNFGAAGLKWLALEYAKLKLVQ